MRPFSVGSQYAYRFAGGQGGINNPIFISRLRNFLISIISGLNRLLTITDFHCLPAANRKVYPKVYPKCAQGVWVQSWDSNHGAADRYCH